MGKKIKDKTKKEKKGPTREQLANENRLASISARAKTAKFASDAIKSALSGDVKSKSIKFSDSESEDEAPKQKLQKLKIMEDSSSESESGSDSESNSDSEPDSNFMETQSNASSEDFFDKQDREKALRNDPRFQTETLPDKNSADSLQAEKMGLFSMMADITGKQQVTTEQRSEQRFLDPNKMKFDPTKEDTDGQPINKKPKLDESKNINKSNKQVEQDMDRFVKIDSDVNLTDLFGKNKKVVDKESSGGFNFGFDTQSKSSEGGFNFEPKKKEKPVKKPDENTKTYAKTFEGLSSSSEDDSSTEYEKSDSEDEPKPEKPDTQMETDQPDIKPKYHKLCDIPVKSDQEIYQNWESKRDRLLESVRKRYNLLKKQHNPDKNNYFR